jgi:hypothetical protein
MRLVLGILDIHFPQNRSLMIKIIFAFYLGFFSLHSFAAVISTYDNGKGCWISGVRLSGEIERGDLQNFNNALTQLKKKYGVSPCTSGSTHVYVDSNGGDVDEALLIGKEIRQNKLNVTVTEGSHCYSSCVFLLAGGIDRYVMGSVGIHRPYFTAISKDKSADEIRTLRESLNLRIKNFFKFVDVPESLLDEMLSYPPENIKILTEQELLKYRLTGKDATVDELDTANHANYYNLSSAEYRKRNSKASICFRKYSVNKNIDKLEPCVQSFLLNVKEEEAIKRNERVSLICSGITDSVESWKCRRRILVENR